MLIYQIAVGSFIGVTLAVGAIVAIEVSIEYFKNRTDD